MNAPPEENAPTATVTLAAPSDGASAGENGWDDDEPDLAWPDDEPPLDDGPEGPWPLESLSRGDDADRMAERRTSMLCSHLDELARDVGRLRRRVDGESYDGFLIDQISGHVETLDCLLGITAAELYRSNVAFGADEDEAIACALHDAGARSDELRALLGCGEARP